MDEQQTTLQQPKVPPPLARLADWAGRWTAAERYEKSEWMPNGGTAQGTAEVRVGPGGVLIEEYHSTGSPMGAWDGILLLTHDGKEYVAYWFDSFNPRGTLCRGDWKGDRLTLEGEGTDMNGKPYTFAMDYDVKPDSRLLTAANDGRKSFEIEYRRAATH